MINDSSSPAAVCSPPHQFCLPAPLRIVVWASWKVEASGVVRPTRAGRQDYSRLFSFSRSTEDGASLLPVLHLSELQRSTGDPAGCDWLESLPSGSRVLPSDWFPSLACILAGGQSVDLSGSIKGRIGSLEDLIYLKNSY